MLEPIHSLVKRRRTIDIVVIGHGAIGRMVVGEIGKATGPAAVRGVLVRPARLAETRRLVPAGTEVITTVEEALRLDPEMVVECAGQGAVADYGNAILAEGVDFMIIAVGALADAALRDRLLEAAGCGGARILLPAGAIAGIDGLAALRLGGLETVRYVSTKPPIAWKGTPAEAAFDLESLTEKTIVFSGPADEAARRYPKNANIAAIVALAGIGFERTKIDLVADPSVTDNIGRIEAEGTYGRLSAELRGHPDPDNPKTSACTALSILNALHNRTNTIVLG